MTPSPNDPAAQARAQYDPSDVDPELSRTALSFLSQTPNEHDDDEASPPRGRHWQSELARWLATLDSQRTRREYEKAVSYFFKTPGVPASIEALTLDLLLAYRGSLALRAAREPTARFRSPPRPNAFSLDGQRGSRTSTILLDRPPIEPSDAEDGDPATEQEGESQAPSKLAPATVNVRLTALRQFLAHCSLWGYLPDLAPERMRAALRRLHIERRRPYQVLAEPEWESFLQAARSDGASRRTPALPAQDSATRTTPRTDPVRESATGTLDAHDERFWGTTRAARQRTAALTHPDTATTIDDEGIRRGPAQLPDKDAALVSPPLLRSRAGLTGARTARRDHAMLALALATGLRAIELCSLDLGDISREWNAGQEEWWLILPDAKTKGQRGGRTIPLGLSLVHTLFDYARATGRSWSRAGDRATPLFLSGRRPVRQVSGKAESEKPAESQGRPDERRLSPQHVRRIVDRVETQWLAAQYGIEGIQSGRADARAISPHALRHSTAVALLEGNERGGRPPASVEHVRGWLGHFDIRTTQGYLAHLDARRHRRPFVLQPSSDAVAEQDPPKRETADASRAAEPENH